MQYTAKLPQIQEQIFTEFGKIFTPVIKRSVMSRADSKAARPEYFRARGLFYYRAAGQMLFLRLRLIFATTSRTGTFIPVVIVASSIS